MHIPVVTGVTVTAASVVMGRGVLVRAPFMSTDGVSTPLWLVDEVGVIMSVEEENGAMLGDAPTSGSVNNN